jgi:voltage-gated potassium channel
MSASVASLSASQQRRRKWESLFAGPMFFLTILFLIALAGFLHRLPRLEWPDPELQLILAALGGLWLVFILEAGVRLLLRDRAQPARTALVAAAVFGLLPPLRMACRSQVRPTEIWLPGPGWHEINGSLRRTLERAFSVPMVFFALMVLPLFALEYFEADRIHASLVLTWWLDVGASVIWLAFAIELIVMVTVAERPWNYLFMHWIDLAIVLLPAIEMLPLLRLFRLLRISRMLRAEQLLRWGRLHRLKGLLARCWRALLLLRIVQRATGRSLESRCQQLQDLLHAREEEIEGLRQEIQEVEQLIAQRALSDKKPAPRGTPTTLAGATATIASPAMT